MAWRNTPSCSLWGKLSLYKCTWRDPRFGQSGADMGEEDILPKPTEEGKIKTRPTFPRRLCSSRRRRRRSSCTEGGSTVWLCLGIIMKNSTLPMLDKSSRRAMGVCCEHHTSASDTPPCFQLGWVWQTWLNFEG